MLALCSFMVLENLLLIAKRIIDLESEVFYEKNNSIVNVCNFNDFWGDSLYREVLSEDRIIINLASKEYSKCVEKYLRPQDTYITIVFGELIGDKVVTKGVYAKMARGEMVRFMAEIGAQHPEQIKEFGRGYRFDEKRSTDTEYVFISNTDKHIVLGVENQGTL